MRTLFISQGLWELVTTGQEPVINVSEKDKEIDHVKQKYTEELRMKDARALLLIHQGVSETIFPRIMAAESAKQAWDILKLEYQGSTKVIALKLQVFWKDFENYR